MDDMVCIGSVYRTHGLKGELKLTLGRDQLPDSFQPEVLFIQIEPTPVPFFLSTFKFLEGKKALIKLEGIDNLEEASKLLKKDIFVPLEQLNYREERQDFAKLIGYTLQDESMGDLGTITDILDMPMQQVAQIEYKGHEVMIPLVNETVVEIDNKKQILYVNIPEGLLDLYE